MTRAFFETQAANAPKPKGPTAETLALVKAINDAYKEPDTDELGLLTERTKRRVAEIRNELLKMIEAFDQVAANRIVLMDAISALGSRSAPEIASTGLIDRVAHDMSIYWVLEENEPDEAYRENVIGNLQYRAEEDDDIIPDALKEAVKLLNSVLPRDKSAN
jgi:hypothetical protein